MEHTLQVGRIFFREKQQDGFSEYSRELTDLEDLRNFLRINMITRVSLRINLRSLNRYINIKSLINPKELTQNDFDILSGKSKDIIGIIIIYSTVANKSQILKTINNLKN